ncbi:MAG: FAD-binding oxidoreductase [bacterium]|jgi:glycolate oxidase FAD binding subunit|nr:FAD-binding oxidoreductase [candidate division KSB1 bacterium]MDH7558686.1 FAD-binding oxidoreductase [bacterium]
MSRARTARWSGAILTDKAEVRFDSGTLQRFAVDGVLPSAVVRPQSEEELSQWLREAHRQQAKVLVWGAGELMHIGGRPEPFDLAICTTRLRRVLDFDPENLTVSVEAGMALQQLQALVRARSLWLPLDPPVSQRATVGGIVAANAFGPRRQQYGGVRDLLLGCRVVLADGTVVKTGGKTVKNVAGYDLSKLFVGSLGSIGLLSGLTLRLSPLPESARTVLAAFPEREDCCKAAGAMVRSPLSPAAVEVISPGVLSGVTVGELQGHANAHLLALLFEGKRQVVAAATRAAEAELRSTAAEVRVLAAGPGGHFWRAIGELLQGAAGRLQVRVNVPMSEVEAVLARIEQVARNRDCRAELVSHYGLGVITANIDADQGTELEVARELAMLRTGIAAQGGSVVFTRAKKDTKDQLDVWGARPETFDLMQRLKQEFDSRGVFAGGRFVGG